MTLTFGSIFAGIGGLDLGFERAGMVCRWQVEIDPFCQKVLAKHWPDVARYWNVRDCGEHNLEPVDLICGGFPCQPHSTGGHQLGGADERDLWPEMRRIIKELQPTWVIAENVLGIRATILDEILSDVDRLGYETGALIIPAAAFGAPHKRDRFWIVAHTTRIGRDERVRNWEKGPGIWHRDATGPLAWPENFNDYAYRSGFLRVANGVPARVDRLRALGNAVVPQVAEWLGRRIVEVEDATHR